MFNLKKLGVLIILTALILLTSNAAEKPSEPEPMPWGSVELRAWTYEEGASLSTILTQLTAPEGYSLWDILTQTISINKANSSSISPAISPLISFFFKGEIWSIFNPEEFENALENIGASEGALLTLTGMLKDNTYVVGKDTFKILVLRGHMVSQFYAEGYYYY